MKDVVMVSPLPRRSVYADKLSAFGDFAFADAGVYSRRGKWTAFFRERIGAAFSSRIVFEIGCADGGLLARVAAKHPAVGFVGLDWKCKAMFDAATRVSAAGLRNVALLRGRAQEIGAMFAPRELDDVWLFHPEPCDKPAERNNRLVAEPFLLDVATVLRNGESRFVLKTDHAGYFQWTLALFGEPPPAWAARSEANPSRREDRVPPIAVRRDLCSEGRDPAQVSGRSAACGTRSTTGRINGKDVLASTALPPASDAVRKALRVVARSDGDGADGRSTPGRPRLDAGEVTAYEARFLRRKQAIFELEISLALE